MRRLIFAVSILVLGGFTSSAAYASQQYNPLQSVNGQYTTTEGPTRFNDGNYTTTEGPTRFNDGNYTCPEGPPCITGPTDFSDGR